jgi:hypothetical protein
MSEALEAKLEAHMHESVQSAQAIADAEARAASMHDNMMTALREQQAAEARTAQLEARIQEEVSLRMRTVGADRALWPQVHSSCCTVHDTVATFAKDNIVFFFFPKIYLELGFQ